MYRRLTAAALVLLVAAPIASVGPAFGDEGSGMGCCPAEDDAGERPVITGRCCCDVDRDPPVEPQVSTVTAVNPPDHAIAGAGAALPTGDELAAAPRSLAVPRPRGPPPRPPALLAFHKTSFLL